MEELKLKVVCGKIEKTDTINTLHLEVSDGPRSMDMKIEMPVEAYCKLKDSSNLPLYIRERIRQKIKIEFIGGIE